MNSEDALVLEEPAFEGVFADIEHKETKWDILKYKVLGLREVWAFDNRSCLTFTKLLFPKENLLVYRYRGMDILTDRIGGDAHGARDLLTSPMYSRFFDQMRFSGPINVLDLGANNGGFPLLLSVSGIDLKKVVSVEFNPNTFVRLHFNLLRNLDCEVLPINAALCGEEQDIEMQFGSGGPSDSIYDNVQNSTGKVSKIKGITLDGFYDTYFKGEVIDICKIDVEGAEFDVFRGPSHESLKRCRYVIMEIHEHGERRKSEIVPVIENLGFTRQETELGADPWVHLFINSQN